MLITRKLPARKKLISIMLSISSSYDRLVEGGGTISNPLDVERFGGMRDGVESVHGRGVESAQGRTRLGVPRTTISLRKRL